MAGYDLSNNNGGAFPDDPDFAFLKASEGATFDDKTFERYVELCQRGNVPWGAYHFAHPDENSPQIEAEWFLRNARRGPLGWALDVETRDHGRISPLAIIGVEALADWCEEFRSIVEPELDRSWFYTFRDYATHLFPRLSASWSIWLATAAGQPSFPTFAGRAVVVEQYTQEGGFDVNFAHTDITGDDMFTEQDRVMLSRLHDRVRSIDEVHAAVSTEPDLRLVLAQLLAEKGDVSAETIANVLPPEVASQVVDEINKRFNG